MTDRELLEAAAKVAGIEWLRDRIGDSLLLDLSATGGDDAWPWNPLTDDGDALRLAVKLNLDIEFDTLPDGPIVGVVAPWNEDRIGLAAWIRVRAGTILPT